MYVIYYGKGKSMLTSMAAAIHVEDVIFDYSSSKFDFPIENFLNIENQALGRLIYIGNDSNNNQVFVLNTSSAESIILPALSSVFDLLQVPRRQLYLADTSELENFSITFGLWLYRRGFFRCFATNLIYSGVKSEYEKLHKLIEKTKIFSEKD